MLAVTHRQHMLFSSAVRLLLIINGLYDITCACAILFVSATARNSFIFSSIHLNVFAHESIKNHPVVRRLLAYWILTYGVARLSAGVHRGFSIAALTYFVEAACYHYESTAGGTMIQPKALFVSLSSIVLGALVISQHATDSACFCA